MRTYRNHGLLLALHILILLGAGVVIDSERACIQDDPAFST
jgi:hypothetical protein